MMYISYTKLSCYQLCPRQYRYHYVDGLAKKYETEKPYLSLGKSVHSALNDFFSLPPPERSFNKLKILLSKNWSHSGYSSDLEEREYLGRAIKMLDSFYRHADLSVKPRFLEQMVQVKLPNSILTAKIDRIDELPEGGCEIIDYKTGRNLPFEDIKKDKQLLIYDFAVRERYADMGLIPKKVSFYFLEHGKKLETSHSDDEIEKIKEEVIKTVDTINTDESFEPCVNNLCPFCDYIIICPAHRPPHRVLVEDFDSLPPEKKFRLLEEQLDQTIQNLYALNYFATELTAVMDYQRLKKKSVDVFMRLAGMKMGVLYLLYNDETVLRAVVAEGFGPKTRDLIELSLEIPVKEDSDSLLVKTLLEEKFMINIENIREEPKDGYEKFIFTDFDSEELLPFKDNIVSLTIIPIRTESRKIGVMLLANDQNPANPLSRDHNRQTILQNLANHAAISFENTINYYKATTDHLTEIYNRSFFDRSILEMMEDSRLTKKPIGLLMMDIDHFKNFNDTYGHHTGDKVLKKVAAIIRKSIRPLDIGARYGGEEFAVILKNADTKITKIVAERIRKQIEENAKIDFNGKELSVTISIGGLATIVEGDISQETLLKEADANLYHSKEAGRNCVTMSEKFTAELEEKKEIGEMKNGDGNKGNQS